MVEHEQIQIFRCTCGEEFNVTGYPHGYKFACPQCHAFCVVKDVDAELAKGTILADFMIEKKIGQGGMGVVYVGRQRSLERPVAIKALKPHVAKNQDFIRRFTRETRTAAQVIHNNIVQVYYVGQERNLDRLLLRIVH